MAMDDTTDGMSVAEPARRPERVVSMKKSLICLFALALLLSLAAPAETDGRERHRCGDYLYVLLDDGTAEVTYYYGLDEALVIPSELDRLKVTGIGDRAFETCGYLTSVVFPDSVTRIGDGAFEGCSETLTLTVGSGSCAEQYCKDNALNCVYPGSRD